MSGSSGTLGTDDKSERLSPHGHCYSALLPRRRMKINTPKTTTKAAHTSRRVVPSIAILLSHLNSSAVYMFSIIGKISRMSRVNTGPTVTTNSDGSTQKKIGKTSLTASLAARSSARCRAITRM